MGNGDDSALELVLEVSFLQVTYLLMHGVKTSEDIATSKVEELCRVILCPQISLCQQHCTVP